MRHSVLALVLVSTVGLHGQTNRPAPVTTGTATIRGRVLAAETRAPIRNAFIELEQDGRIVSGTLADGDGRFALLALPAGRFRLTAAKPGYVKATFGATRQSRAVQRIQLRDGTALNNLQLELSKAGAIGGRILDDVGEPLFGASVTATLLGDNGQISASGETDDLGQYRIGGLSPGRYSLAVTLSPGLTSVRMVTAAGGGQMMLIPNLMAHAQAGGIRVRANASSSYFYYPGVDDHAAALAVELVAGEERTAIDFNLPAVAPAGVGRTKEAVASAGRVGPNAAMGPNATAEVSGRVVDADGRPLARAQVRFERLDASGIGTGTLTDEDGRYEVTGLRAGEYTVVAEKRRYLDAEYGQSRAFERGQALRVAAGDRRDRVDLVLPRAGSVAGRIVDEYGEPVEGARVQALQSRFEGGQAHLVEVEGASRRTDDLGSYRISGLQPGSYMIRAALGQAEGAHEGPQPSMAAIPGYAPSYYPGTAKPSDARWVTVGVSDDVREVELAMVRVPTARISGHAFTSSGDTVKGGLLLKPSHRSGAVDATPLRPSTIWGPDGFFEFSNVPPGEYVLQAAMGRAHMWAEGEFFAQYLTVNGANLDDLVVRTSPGSTITGRVTFEGGEAPRSTEISLSPVPADPDLAPAFGAGPLALGPPARSEMHSDWTFEIEGISGPRRLLLSYPPAGWALKSIDVNGADVTDAVLMFGRPDQSLRDVHVVLTNQMTTVEGVVTDVRGRPSRNCLVVAFAVDRERRSYPSRFLDHSVCERDGSFVIRRLPPEEYFIAALERRTNEGPEDWRDPRVLDQVAPRAMRVTLSEGQRLTTALRTIIP